MSHPPPAEFVPISGVFSDASDAVAFGATVDLSRVRLDVGGVSAAQADDPDLSLFWLGFALDLRFQAFAELGDAFASVGSDGVALCCARPVHACHDAPLCSAEPTTLSSPALDRRYLEPWKQIHTLTEKYVDTLLIVR